MQKATREICELQLEDPTLTPYFQYLEEHKLPTSESESRRIILECENFEVIDRVLHHDNPGDSSQWCVVLGIDKLNTSGYHPQTDGLVEILIEHC